MSFSAPPGENSVRNFPRPVHNPRPANELARHARSKWPDFFPAEKDKNIFGEEQLGSAVSRKPSVCRSVLAAPTPATEEAKAAEAEQREARGFGSN
jgi:hypothetical protein